MHITNMDFHKRDSHACQCIPNRNARMRECARINHDGANVFISCGVDAVDEVAFVIGLEGGEVKGVFLGEGGGG